MTFDQFVLLVERMRIAQRWYFQERTQYRLVTAKKLEREVDLAIEDSATFTLGKFVQEVIDEDG